jgi:AcrR family transcriptional regulator
MVRDGRRAGLDEPAVLRAAAELVDAEGWHALSLVRLAQRLGVRAPSLYNHVAGLDGVRRGLALMGLGELRRRLERAAIGKSGADALTAMAGAYRKFAREHPGLYAAGLQAPAPDDVGLTEVATDILAILHAVLAPYGLDETGEVHAIRGFRSVLHGFVSLELAGAFGMPVDIEASYDLLVRLLVAGLPTPTAPPPPVEGSNPARRPPPAPVQGSNGSP